MERENDSALQQAIDKVMAAVATATNAAEVAKSQASAAAAAAAKLAPPDHVSESEQIHAALNKVPYIGQVLAIIAKRVGVSVAFLVVFFLVLAPLLYPLLVGAYLPLLPKNLQILYTQFVLESFDVDDVVSRSVQETAAMFVAQNNERIDFVQQFQQTWTKNGSDKSSPYRFPIKDGQEFIVTLKPTQHIKTATCVAGSAKAVAARSALNNDRLFIVRAFGKQQATSSGSLDSDATVVVTEKFWLDQPSLLGARKEGVVQVVIDETIASKIWECWQIQTDLTIIVHKTLKNLARTKPPAIAAVPITK